MPDIRDVLNGLDDNDRRLYAETRTAMRRAYMAAFTACLNMSEWDVDDDRVVDLIDIQVATLFVRAGRFDHKQHAGDPQGGVIDDHAAAQLEAQIKAEAEKIVSTMKPSTASQRVLDAIAVNGNNASNGAWPTSS